MPRSEHSKGQHSRNAGQPERLISARLPRHTYPTYLQSSPKHRFLLKKGIT